MNLPRRPETLLDHVDILRGGLYAPRTLLVEAVKDINSLTELYGVHRKVSVPTLRIGLDLKDRRPTKALQYLRRVWPKSLLDVFQSKSNFPARLFWKVFQVRPARPDPNKLYPLRQYMDCMP